jgi:catechol 2,3-dioxygenase-like lactoylglutathione lyase family enzyme
MKLNHVAITMEPDALDDAARAEILEFYGDVFGWIEGDNTGEEGDPLILYTGAFGQFVYLLPGDPALTAPPLDHFGVLVDTIDELQEIADKVQRWCDRDERVRFIDVHARNTQGATNDYTLTSVYVGFLLPLMIEVQHLDAKPRAL